LSDSAISLARTAAAIFESRLRIDAHEVHGAMRCQEQPQGSEDEQPFHGRPPFEPRFPPLKVTGITQIADQGPAKPATYKSVIPVTFTHAKP
jgi:hypothetical protein